MFLLIELRFWVHFGLRVARFSSITVFATIFLFVSAFEAIAEDCNPVRNCDANRDCSPQVDTRDCEPHWSCDCNPWTLCLNKLGCEANKGTYKANCETQKGVQNRAYDVAKLACETQKSAEKFDCERVKLQDKKLCELGLAGPWRCDSGEVVFQTRTEPQDGLTDADELIAFATTPLKTLGGQLSWRDTACTAYGVGIPYRNSQRSSDNFCTIDVQLVSFTIDGVQKPPGNRYLRLEVLPGGKGSQLCAARTISTQDVIKFDGPVKTDKHFPGKRWLEVHVTDDLEIVPPGAAAAPSGTPTQTSTSNIHRVLKNENLSLIAQATYKKQIWQVIYRANRVRIRHPDIIRPGQLLILPTYKAPEQGSMTKLKSPGKTKPPG